MFTTLLDEILEWEDFLGRAPRGGYWLDRERWRFKKEDSEAILEIDLPGVKKSDISLEAGDGRLEIKWKKKEVERSKTFNLPAEYGEDLKAKLEDGILEIRMGYNSKKKKIEVL